MAILTQRLLIIAILISLTLTIAQDQKHNPTILSFDAISKEVDKQEYMEEQVESEEGTWGSVKAVTSNLVDNSIGNVIKWGIELLTLFNRAINPFAVTPSQFPQGLERAMAWVLTLFRSLLSAIIIVQAYKFFKSKSD